MSKRIYVIGYKGMLGRYVYNYFNSREYELVGISRNDTISNCDLSIPTSGIDVANSDENILSFLLHERGLTPNDVIINCAGTIKPMVDKYGTLNAIKVNSIFPHHLAKICEKIGCKMITITSDCVFSGKDGLYNENSPHDCTDIYGKTKSLGEPSNCTVVRTSIIGEEIGQSRSLIEWVKSMKDKNVNGFTNHNWNGLTCLQVAKVFYDIVVNEKYWDGIRHIFSPNILTKYELVKTISDVYDLNIKIDPVEAPSKCDRSLSTLYDNNNFNIPPINIQIEEQRNYF